MLILAHESTSELLQNFGAEDEWDRSLGVCSDDWR
jgi:hypothetical protein